MSSMSMQLGHATGMSIVRSFIKSQFGTKPRRPPADTDLSGQVAFITGSALSHLILAVRSPEKGENAANKLRVECPTSKIDVWPLEMSSFPSIQAFCRRVETDLSRLDITILNAGIIQENFGICSTGHQEVIQVNFLSTFLLSILMLPICKNNVPRSSPGRFRIVSSGVALWAKLPNRDKRPLLASFDDPKDHRWDPAERYFSSKMLGHLFFVRMLEYLNADDVIVNLVEPGMCKGSELHRGAKGAAAVFLNVFKALTGRKPQDGPWTYVDAAVVKGKSPIDVSAWTGRFIRRPIMDALWEETLAEFEFAGARAILEKCKKREII
ncbi:hypothetical protein V1525DRAFT_455410 [Lipomyces kononenkoae]|uniref:Uncharacterized protein n=1 Tax=Lipomyces kononenkoae TaxID=34357 RepID=A0ACC3T4M6_LIPKO